MIALCFMSTLNWTSADMFASSQVGARQGPCGRRHTIKSQKQTNCNSERHAAKTAERSQYIFGELSKSARAEALLVGGARS